MFDAERLGEYTNRKTVERTAKRILDDTARNTSDRWEALQWLANDRLPVKGIDVGGRLLYNNVCVAENLGYTIWMSEYLTKRIFGRHS